MLHRSYRESGLTYGQLAAIVGNEAAVLGRLRHRNVVRLVDSFVLGKVFFLASELVHGRDLLSYVIPSGVQEPFAKHIFWQLCDAVSYLRSVNVCVLPETEGEEKRGRKKREEEERERKRGGRMREGERDRVEGEGRGDLFLLILFLSLSSPSPISPKVIHGDLKAENVLIRDSDHRVKLIDFGFSHIVVPGVRLKVHTHTQTRTHPLKLSFSLSFCSFSLSLPPISLSLSFSPFSHR